MVSEIDDAGVTLSDGRRIESVLVVLWAAGVQASELGQMLGVETDRSDVPVEVDLSVPGHREVFVTG